MAAVDLTSSQARPPPLTDQQSDAVTSLLSLSLANGEAAAIPVRNTTSTSSTDSALSGVSSGSFQTSPTTTLDNRAVSTSSGSSTVVGAMASTATAKHHRRLGSTGKTRRRLSDAREASARPFPQHSLLSLASLSLSTSPGALSSKPLAPRPRSGSNPSGIPIASNDPASPTQVTVTSSPMFETAMAIKREPEKDVDKTTSGGSTPIPISVNGKQKKRGVDYRCESCAKIYRHPNCLNKHRWEHTRQWREASKFVLSKHQQVQLLEAAAILSFMGTTSTSLPEDRSEWPSFLSGGSLPKVEAVSNAKDKEFKSSSSAANASSQKSGHMSSFNASNNGLTTTSLTPRLHPVPLSTSVPARMSAHSYGGGPRMHDFTLPPSSSIIGSGPPAAQHPHQWRPAPGLVGVHTPTNNGNSNVVTHQHPSAQVNGPPGVVRSSSMGDNSSIHPSGGWTSSSSHIPSSSVRSESSVSAGSRSRSGSRSINSRSDGSELEPDMEDEDVDVEVMDADTAEDDEHEKLVSRSEMTTTATKTKARKYEYGYGSVPVSVQQQQNGPLHNTQVYNVTVGSHPYGSYGAYHRQTGYDSYGSSGTATAAGSFGSLSGYSSHGNPNITNGTAGSFGHGSYVHRRRSSSTSSFASRARRGSIGMVKKGLRTEEDDDDDMGVAVKEEDEDEDRDREKRWNGMEMEVDMDMD